MKKDPSVIGICRLGDILDPSNQLIRKDVAIMPIDRDGNGLIDHTEDIYTDYNSFTRGVWIGKYPHALVNNIYSCSSIQPENSEAKAFLTWVLGDGQKFNAINGYTDLLAYESQTNTEKLLLPVIQSAEQGRSRSIFVTLLIVSVILIIIGFILDLASRLLSKPANQGSAPATIPVLDPSVIELPAGLYYDKTHTWAFLESDGFVRVGIDESLRHITGAITKIKMKSEGDKVKKGEEILSVVRNGKQLNLYAPVSGTIHRKNRTLETDVTKLNTSPYTEGWVYTLEPDNWTRESQLLLVAGRYREFISGEISRLKDFLSSLTAVDKFATVVLQDGGALADGPLAEMEPVVWEEFQTKFIDQSRQVWFYELF
jgi:glycine cleavage system H lipoate-binding protein